MNNLLKQLLNKYKNGEFDYPWLLARLDGMLANSEIDQETYDILIGIF